MKLKAGNNQRSVMIVGNKMGSLLNFRGELIKAWQAQGYKVIALSPMFDQDQENLEKLNNMGVEYEEIPLNRTSINILKDLILVLHLFNLFKKYKPTKVFNYSAKPVIFGSIAAKLAQVRDVYSWISGLGHFFTDTGKDFSFKQRFLLTLISQLYKFALRFNKGIIFVNHDDRDLFLEKKIVSDFDKCAVVNGSGIDLGHYYPSENMNESVSFLMIARILRDKGVIEYFKAAEQVKNEFPNVHFGFLGAYDDNPTAIKPSELSYYFERDIVEYFGSDEDVRPYISDCSVFVLPSYREGRPRTVLEAMSMKRAVITTDVPGCRETVQEGYNGYLVEVRNIPSLVSSMLKFINDRSKIDQMGAYSRIIAEKQFDVSRVNSDILQVMGILT